MSVFIRATCPTFQVFKLLALYTTLSSGDFSGDILQASGLSLLNPNVNILKSLEKNIFKLKGSVQQGT